MYVRAYIPAHETRVSLLAGAGARETCDCMHTYIVLAKCITIHPQTCYRVLVRGITYLGYTRAQRRVLLRKLQARNYGLFPTSNHYTTVVDKKFPLRATPFRFRCVKLRSVAYS